MKSRYLLFFLILIYIISPCTATGDYKFRTMSPSGGFYYDGIKYRAGQGRFYLDDDGL